MRIVAYCDSRTEAPFPLLQILVVYFSIMYSWAQSYDNLKLGGICFFILLLVCMIFMCAHYEDQLNALQKELQQFQGGRAAAAAPYRG